MSAKSPIELPLRTYELRPAGLQINAQPVDPCKLLAPIELRSTETMCSEEHSGEAEDRKRDLQDENEAPATSGPRAYPTETPENAKLSARPREARGSISTSIIMAEVVS